MKHAKLVAAVIIVIVLGLGTLMNFNSITTSLANFGKAPTASTTSTTTAGTTVTTPVSGAGYQGAVSLNYVITDPLSAATLTDVTNVGVTFYVQNADGSYSSKGTGAANTLSYSVVSGTPTIYMGLKIPAGQKFYPALDKMGNAYFSRLQAPFWATPDMTSLYQPVFPLNVQNMQAQGTGITQPSISIPIQLYTQATTTNVSFNSGSYQSNTNHTAVGAGLVQNSEPMPLTIAQGGTAIALYQFQMSLNDTTLSDINVAQSYCTFPTGLLGAAPVQMTFAQAQQIPGASTTVYIFNIAPDYTIRTAPLVEVPKIGTNYVGLNCNIATNLAATNNGITFTPSLIWIDMQAALNTVTAHTFKIVA